MESFVQLIDFTGLTFDQALRKFLCESNFRLAGEAQKIDRMMTEFGRHFHSHEPKIFQTEGFFFFSFFLFFFFFFFLFIVSNFIQKKKKHHKIKKIN